MDLSDMTISMTDSDLGHDHFRYDPELPKGWALVRPVALIFHGARYWIDYQGQPGDAVPLVHAYLDQQDILLGGNH